MNYRLAKNGERLDTIVFEEYGTLSVLPQVLEVNPQITLKLILEDRDVVYFPTIASTDVTNQGISLWD